MAGRDTPFVTPKQDPLDVEALPLSNDCLPVPECPPADADASTPSRADPRAAVQAKASHGLVLALFLGTFTSIAGSIIMELLSTAPAWKLTASATLGLLTCLIAVHDRRVRLRIADLERSLATERRKGEKATAYISVLQQRQEEMQSGFLDGLQYTLAQVFRVYRLGRSERITIYTPSNGRFLKLARFSPNPGFMGTGRPSYPLGEGTIAEAYREGFAFVDRLADPGSARELGTWLEQQEQMGVPPRTAVLFSMKARAMGAFTVYDGTLSPLEVVVVIESVQPDGLTRAMVEAVRDDMQGHLGKLIKLIERHTKLPLQRTPRTVHDGSVA